MRKHITPLSKVCRIDGSILGAARAEMLVLTASYPKDALASPTVETPAIVADRIRRAQPMLMQTGSS
jgi:hypothetical protein